MGPHADKTDGVNKISGSTSWSVLRRKKRTAIYMQALREPEEGTKGVGRMAHHGTPYKREIAEAAAK